MLMRNQLKVWALIFATLVLFLYVFNGILLPFILGGALAYALDPVADWLEKIGMSRVWATATILLLSVIGFVVFIVLLVPLLIEQVVGLAERLPSYVDRLRELSSKIVPQLTERIGAERTAELQAQFSDLMSKSAGLIDNLARSLLASSLTILNIASLFVVTPVVAFYLLLDWDRMVARIDQLLPLDHADTIREVARDIGIAISGFVRGQGTVILILGVFYATALSLIGLNHGVAIGVMAAILGLVPYVGVTVGFVVALGVAFVQFWPEWGIIVGVGGIFVFGQLVEGNVLQPKLVGGSIGVHPVWLMFSLFAFGSLFGFVGLLLALPLAAVIGVLVKFAVAKYLGSSLYAGAGKPKSKSTGKPKGKPRAKPAAKLAVKPSAKLAPKWKPAARAKEK